MNTKELIISLLKQDMKHNQLIIGLEQLGFIGDDYHELQIFEMVSELMGLRPGTVSNEWGDIYIAYMQKAGQCDIEPLGKNLHPLAEECYDRLLESLKH